MSISPHAERGVEMLSNRRVLGRAARVLAERHGGLPHTGKTEITSFQGHLYQKIVANAKPALDPPVS